jgi:hypothetical protein
MMLMGCLDMKTKTKNNYVEVDGQLREIKRRRLTQRESALKDMLTALQASLAKSSEDRHRLQK